MDDPFGQPFEQLLPWEVFAAVCFYSLAGVVHACGCSDSVAEDQFLVDWEVSGRVFERCSRGTVVVFFATQAVRCMVAVEVELEHAVVEGEGGCDVRHCFGKVGKWRDWVVCDAEMVEMGFAGEVGERFAVGGVWRRGWYPRSGRGRS